MVHQDPYHPISDTDERKARHCKRKTEPTNDKVVMPFLEYPPDSKRSLLFSCRLDYSLPCKSRRQADRDLKRNNVAFYWNGGGHFNLPWPV